MDRNGKDWRVEIAKVVSGFGWPAVLLAGVLYFNHIEKTEGDKRVVQSLQEFSMALREVAANDKERIKSERQEAQEYITVFKSQVEQLKLQGSRREKEIEVLTEILRELRSNNR